MVKQRLDNLLVARKMVPTRSQAESYIKLGRVKVNSLLVTKPGTLIADDASVTLEVDIQYVSRAALKLDSVVRPFHLTFEGKMVLDVGSSTGGFTDYALTHGARHVYAVELGKDQLHPRLRADRRVTSWEKTDIRSVVLLSSENTSRRAAEGAVLPASPDIVLADISFMSLRDILPSVAQLSSPRTQLLIMMKPQFEADRESMKHHGVIKNDRMRREIIKQFEKWLQERFLIRQKADSAVRGAKGNQERFYLLSVLPKPASKA